MSSTDQAWEAWGASDPYYGVLTNPKFRSASLNAAAKEEFFHTGRCHVEYVLQTCRRVLDPSFTPYSVLDFGCGVGRLLIPFAGLARHVVGMDVSPSMLAEARINCDAMGAQGVALVPSDDELSAAPGPFDLVHTCIVLQHIEIDRGRTLFARLVDRVRPGGIGALHVTYGWDVHAATYGMPPPPPIPAPPTAFEQLKAGLRAWGAPPRVASKDEARDPEMQMNFYSVNELMFMLQRAGVREVHTHFTDHGGALGVFLFFRRPESTPMAASSA